MRKRLASLLMAWVLFVSMFGIGQLAQAEVTTEDALSESISTIVQEKLSGANVSIAIMDRMTGEVVYDYNGDTPIKPASNMKLITTAAALDVLGEDYRFKTSIYTSGKLSNGVLKGDVYLQGQGDPTLMEEDLRQFAQALKAKGIQTIDGRIVGDDKWFDDDLLTPGIWANDESYYYAAPISALTTSPNADYDSGTIIIEVNGSAIGNAPTVKATPHLGDLEIVNQAQIVAAGQSNTITIERSYRTNEIVISGNLPIDKTKREWVTMQHPTTHTLTMFQAILEQEGIEYKKHKFFRAATPKSANLITVKESMPLKELLIPYMKISNNGIADILVKTMGKVKGNHGSTKAGLKVMEQYGNSINLDMTAWKFEDGSGMSHANSVSGLAINDLLLKVQQEEWFDTYFNSLPVAAHPDRMVGGTLRNRLKDPLTSGNVFAKTGSLTGVSTLSGYIEGSSGEQYIFSVLVQDKSGTATVIDEIVTVMARNL